MEKNINILVSDLKKVFGERLISIILHGSYIKETFIKGVSDVNLIVVVDSLTSLDLSLVKPIIKNWRKTNNAVPVFMDKSEWCSSCDIYALEYSDIQENYKILYGEDLVASLALNPAHIRFQCESEIKNHLIRLRGSYLAGVDSSKTVDSIIRKTISSYMTIIRGVFRVLRLEIPKTNEEILDLFTEKSSIYSGLFGKIIEKRQTGKRFSGKESEEIIKKLIDTLQKMLKFVDEMDKENCHEK